MTREQKIVERWNKKYPVGTEVVVNKGFAGDFEHLVRTVTISEAKTIGSDSGDPVVWMKGVSGCYILTHVIPIPPKTIEEV